MNAVCGKSENEQEWIEDTENLSMGLVLPIVNEVRFVVALMCRPFID